MSHEEYQRKREALLDVLTDAKERGDINLEYDVMEKLSDLRDTFADIDNDRIE